VPQGWNLPRRRAQRGADRDRREDRAGPAASAGRRVRLTGHIRHGEVRVLSGGIAQLSAICSREFLADARRAHAGGRLPTVDDPARGA